MATRRRADLLVALSGVAGRQTDFDTQSAQAAMDTAWGMTSDSYPNVANEIDRILDCTQQDLTAKEILSRVMRFNMDYDADAKLMAVHLAYLMGVAAAPTGTPANEVQRIVKVGTGGTFRVGIPVGSFTKYTPQLAFDISAANLKTALENLNAIGRGNTTVNFSNPNWDITFVNNLANADMPQLVLDTAGLTGGVHTISTTTPGVQYNHALTRISGFQPPAYSLVAGFRNSNKLAKFYKSVVADTFVSRGSHAQPRVTASWGMVGSGEVSNVTAGYTMPTCQIYRPARFKDCRLTIDSVDYTSLNLFRDFEISLSNGIISDDDAFTGQDEDVHRLERADQRQLSLNVGILGEEGDDIHLMAESLSEVPVTFRIGRSGRNILFTIPKASISLRDPVIGYDGTAKRSKIQINIEPELIPGDATTPFTVSAFVPIAATLLGVV